MTAIPIPVIWQKSSYSGPDDGNDCVELRSVAEALNLRESDDPAVVLAVDPAAMAHLLDAVRSGTLPGLL
ncbi:DUF397 domain-containing protein [Streptomyces sp. NPDC091281]|uniref:DUF397 domain-containing protein n=1 Tax=Streptomyces sp. NPDC091281 TaxID=3365985 RepID=UPI0037F3DFEC